MAADERYRLAAVRDARARDERGTQHGLAGAVDDARAAAARLDTARNRTAAARLALASAVAVRDGLLAAPSPTPAPVILRADQFIARRRRELATAIAEESRLEADVAEHTGTVDAARERLARARADRELIERHFARWREQRRKLAERRAD